MTQPQPPEGNDFLMGAGGPPSVSWKGAAVGTVVSGTVAAPPEKVQQIDMDTNKPMYWDDGNPRYQGVVKLARATRNGQPMVDPTNLEDDGTRRLFFKGQLRDVIRDAVLAVGAPGLEVGGTLTVTFLQKEPIPNSKFDRNVYSAAYARPTGGEVLGIEEPAAQPVGVPPTAPYPHAQPAAQPAATVAHFPTTTAGSAPAEAPPGVDPAVYATQPDAVKAAMWNVARGGMVAAG